MLELLFCGLKALLHLFLVLGAAAAQARGELLEGRRRDEHHHRVRALFVHLHRALHLDLEDDVVSLVQLFVHRRFERAVVIVHIARVLQKCVLRDLFLKIRFGEEVVLHAVGLARARRARGRGDRVEQPVVLLAQQAQQRALARTGRAGEYI